MEQLKDDILNVRPINLLETAQRLQNRLPILLEAANTPYRKGEQSVLRHTQEVLDALLAVTLDDADYGAPIMTPWWKATPSMYAAALFHDFGRVSARPAAGEGHSRHSAEIARTILFKLGIPFEIREHAVSLVLHHTAAERYRHLKGADEKMLALACMLDVRALYHMRAVHFRALDGAYARQRLALLEEFRSRALSLDVFGTPPEPPVSAADINEAGITKPEDSFLALNLMRYFRVADAIKDPGWYRERLAQLKNTPAPTMHLMVGIAGSGKSVWLEKNLAGLTRVSTDNVREELTGDAADQRMNQIVFQRCMSRVRQALIQAKPVIFDATNCSVSARQMPVKCARWCNARIIAYFFDVEMDTAVKRNRMRARIVPEEAVARQFNTLSVPGLYECDELIVVDESGRARRCWPVG